MLYRTEVETERPIQIIRKYDQRRSEVIDDNRLDEYSTHYYQAINPSNWNDILICIFMYQEEEFDDDSIIQLLPGLQPIVRVQIDKGFCSTLCKQVEVGTGK